jgi:hypothetical protein
MDFVSTLENIKMIAMYIGDVMQAMAGTTARHNQFNQKPLVSMDEGTKIFASWHKEHYAI